MIISLRMKNVLRHVALHHRLSSISSNTSSLRVQSLCHQHIAMQQTDVDHTIQETRLNTLHLRSIQSSWSTNLARQCPTSGSFPALAFLAFTHPTPTTQAALAVSKTEQDKALDMDPESWRQWNERGGVLFINNSRRRKRRKQRRTSWHQKGTR